jgi:hypothetical protein
MPSLRRLNRRLTRWQRYSARYRDRCDYAMPWGQIYAKAAVVEELERRAGIVIYGIAVLDERGLYAELWP